MRRRLGTVALAMLLLAGCGGQNDTVDFSDEASATCQWARQSVDVLPERSSELLKRAANHLRGLQVPEAQRAAAGTLVGALAHLSRLADELTSDLDANKPNPAHMRRLRAAVQDDQQKIAATARTLGVSGCDAMTAVLLRDRAAAGAAADGEVTASVPKRVSGAAAYRTRLRKALGDLPQRTTRVQAAMRSGNGSSSTLTDYAAVVGTAVNHLQSLRPPASVASAHRDLVGGLRALRTAATRAARDLRAGRQQRAIQVFKRFFASRALKELTAATATLTKRGYLPS
jgi:hypothetical protein